MNALNECMASGKCDLSRDGSSDPGGRGLRGSDASNESDSRSSLGCFWPSERLVQFIKFCMVGGSGLFVDMGILYLLADPRTLGFNLTLSKICAAEIAMINNFVWNEFWTFRRGTASLPVAGGEDRGEVLSSRKGLFRRFTIFNAICGIGIALAVLLLHLFHSWLGWNVYFSNLLAIILVTCWNFWMNVQFNWRKVKAATPYF